MTEKHSILDYHNFFEPDILMSYKGPFNNSILSGIGNYIKEILIDDPEVSYKVFSVFIELAQNIYFYSTVLPEFKNDNFAGSYGTFIIEQASDYYQINAGNIIEDKNVGSIIEKAEKINSLDRKSLRKYRKEMRSKDRSEKGGANIGLIQVALTTSNPLEIEVTPIKNEFSFMSIKTKINR